MSIKINKTYISKRNINGTGNPCKYIIIHETDNTNKGANAKTHASAQYNGHFTDISVHYYCGSDGIYQAAEHTCKCWHIGREYGGNHSVKDATNNNSLGIEICVNSDGNYTTARANAIALVKHLIQTTGIPASRVIRHYDAKGKYCPRKMLDTPSLWTDFKTQIGKTTAEQTTPQTPQAAEKYYRVGTAWKDGICINQIGAYTVLQNAKNSCMAGYYVFDWSGTVVYSVSGSAASPSNQNTKAAQTALNRSFGSNLVVDGIWGAASQQMWNKALQMVLNKDYNAGLAVDRIAGTKTQTAIRTVKYGDNNLLVGVLQIGLYARSYTTGGIDCSFGNATKFATEGYQKKAGLSVDGIAGKNTFIALAK